MSRLGRNQPCHCGSAEKYKKCCLRRDQELEHFVAAGNLERAFTYEAPRILAMLEGLGLDVTIESFVDEAWRTGSSRRLADSWKESLRRPTTHRDVVLLQTSALSLWQQILPDEPCWELLGLEIERGYGLAEHDFPAAFECWWAVWQKLVPRFEPEMTTIRSVESAFGDTAQLQKWIADFVQDLSLSVEVDAEAATMGEKLCSQLLAQFTGRDELWIEILRADHAEFVFFCGRPKEAIELLEELIRDRPHRSIGYAYLAELVAEHRGPREALEVIERAFRQPVENASDFDLEIRIEDFRREIEAVAMGAER